MNKDEYIASIINQILLLELDNWNHEQTLKFQLSCMSLDEFEYHITEIAKNKYDIKSLKNVLKCMEVLLNEEKENHQQN